MSHYWDGTDSLGETYASVLGISPPAWDVYLLFDPDQRWDRELPPKPAFWMHQLEDVTGAPRLDARLFADEADLLAGRDPPDGFTRSGKSGLR